MENHTFKEQWGGKKGVMWHIWSEATSNLAGGTPMLAREIALRYCHYRIKGLC